MKKATALALLLLIVVGFYFGGGLLYFAIQAPGNPADTRYVLVHKGDSPAELSKALANQGLVSDPEKFQMLGRFLRKWGKIKAGEYAVHPGMSPLELFRVLLSGQSVQHPLTVREGENIYEVGESLATKKLIDLPRFMDLVHSKEFMKNLGIKEPLPTSLEGYLYPETYFFNRTQSAEDMIRIMVKKFFAMWNAEWDVRAKLQGFTRYEILTLASMIEKETGSSRERPLISSVFHNRLKQKMRLQSDPTTIYGIWADYQIRGRNLRKIDLERPTPYNTYTTPALPLGPIGNPGIEAIRAALFPAQSEYLFFVSHNDGTHEFSKAYGDHRQAVKKFQIDPKARSGKSWRDLSRKKQQP